MVHWVLEENIFSERSWSEMVAHFDAKQIPWSKVRIIPFSHELLEPLADIEGAVVCYGSLGVQKLARTRGFEPGIWFDEARFNHEAYAEALGDLLLNQDGAVVGIHDVKKFAAKEGLESFFLRPEGDEKQFPGHVIDGEAFDAWYQGMIEAGYLEENDFDVVVSRPKTLGAEYRCVVVDGRLVAWSVYRKYRQPYMKREITEAARRAVLQAVERFQPAPVFVIDVAETDSGEKIIEYNTFNSSGFYLCDVGQIIDSVNAFVETRY